MNGSNPPSPLGQVVRVCWFDLVRVKSSQVKSMPARKYDSLESSSAERTRCVSEGGDAVALPFWKIKNV